MKRWEMKNYVAKDVNCFEYAAAEGIWALPELGLDFAINFGGLHFGGVW